MSNSEMVFISLLVLVRELAVAATTATETDTALTTAGGRWCKVFLVVAFLLVGIGTPTTVYATIVLAFGAWSPVEQAGKSTAATVVGIGSLVSSAA